MSSPKLYSVKNYRARISNKYDLNIEVTDKRLLSSFGYELACYLEIKQINGMTKLQSTSNEEDYYCPPCSKTRKYYFPP